MSIFSVGPMESMAQIPLAPCSRHLLAVAAVSGQLPDSLQITGISTCSLGVVQHGKQCPLYRIPARNHMARHHPHPLQWPGPRLRYGPTEPMTTALAVGQRFSVSRSHTSSGGRNQPTFAVDQGILVHGAQVVYRVDGCPRRMIFVTTAPAPAPWPESFPPPL